MKSDAGDQGPGRTSLRPFGSLARAWEELARLALQPVGARKLSAREELGRMALLPVRDRAGRGGDGIMLSPQSDERMADQAGGTTAVSSRPRADTSWFSDWEDPEASPLPTARADFD